MDNCEIPKIAGTRPCVLELDAGEYYFCRCGKSTKQPFCDGQHKGTAFSPLRFTLDAPEKVAFCACKRTENEPRCDGAHKKL